MKPEYLDEIDHTIFKTLGIRKEQFLSLPEEYQQKFLYYDWQICNNRNIENDRRKKRENRQKRRALKQYEFEEKVKEKILSLIKKR